MGKMLKRIMVSLMGFFIIAVVAENNVQASDVGDRYVTNAELQDGNGDAQTSFDQYDNMQAHYDFTIPANSGVKAGDQMTVDLPKQLILNKSVSFDIVNTDGVVIGKAVADKTTGKLTVTFTDYVETHNNSDITGEMSIWVSWNHDLISSGSSVPIDWGVAGETTINVNDGEGLPDKNEVLYKWGSVDPDDPTLIHWTVRLNYTLKNIKNAVYTDTLGKNQTLVPGSVDAAHGYYTQNTFNKTLAVPASQIVENGQTGFTITLGDLDDTVLMNYDARATDGGASTAYGNSGVLTGDDFKTSTVDVYTPENGGNGTGEGTDNGKPEVPKPEVPKPEVPKPEVPKPEVPKPEVPKPEVPKPEVPTPEVPETKVPDTNKPVTKKPEVIAPVVTPEKPVVKGSAKETNKKTEQQTLPQTGEKLDYQSIWVGLSLILLSSGLVLIARRRR